VLIKYNIFFDLGFLEFLGIFIISSGKRLQKEPPIKPVPP
jgi:hypothetical protein